MAYAPGANLRLVVVSCRNSKVLSFERSVSNRTNRRWRPHIRTTSHGGAVRSQPKYGMCVARFWHVEFVSHQGHVRPYRYHWRLVGVVGGWRAAPGLLRQWVTLVAWRVHAPVWAQRGQMCIRVALR